MKYIKIRYIIGTLAIIAIVVMNFTYAHNNYGIPKMNGITKANATTTAPAYREEKRTSYKNCLRYAYDVVVYSRYTNTIDSIKDLGWIGAKDILYRKAFLSLNLGKALTEANYYANQYNAMHGDDGTWAVVDHVPYYTEIYTEAYFTACEKGGTLPNCKTSDIECEPLDVVS